MITSGLVPRAEEMIWQMREELGQDSSAGMEEEGGGSLAQKLREMEVRVTEGGVGREELRVMGWERAAKDDRSLGEKSWSRRYRGRHQLL